MKVRCLLGMLLVGVLLATGAGSGLAGPQAEGKPPAHSAVDTRLVGDMLQLGAGNNDDNPAIAYSPISDQYLVVYSWKRVDSYTIFGRFVDRGSGGSLGPPMVIASSEIFEMDNPDVAYDSHHDRFLVVWDEFATDPPTSMSSPDLGTFEFEIWGRLLYGGHQSGSSFAGDAFLVASQRGSAYPLRNPTVAYNEDENQYMVVFRRDNSVGDDDYTDIYCRVLASDATQPPGWGSAEGSSVRDYNSYQVGAPDIAWSAAGDSFVAVWHLDRSGDVDLIEGVYLTDTYQASGQLRKSWQVAPYNSGSDPLTKDCRTPSIGYDPVNDAYVVAFVHRDGPALDDTWTLHGQRMRPDYDASGFRYEGSGAFPIDTTVQGTDNQHEEPDVVYSGTADKMHVLYTTYVRRSPTILEPAIQLRTLQGATVSPPLEVREPEDGGAYYYKPALACTEGDCLAVWKEYYFNSSIPASYFMILGQRLGPDCYSLDLGVTPAGGGTATAEPKANCATGGANDYTPGTIVTLTADPAAGYQFSGWTGDTSTMSNPTEIRMDSNRAVTAHFEGGGQACYTLDINVIPDPCKSCTTWLTSLGNCGQDLTYTAGTTLDIWTTCPGTSECVFSHWGGAITGNDDRTTFTMNADKTVQVFFSYQGDAGYRSYLPQAVKHKK